MPINIVCNSAFKLIWQELAIEHTTEAIYRYQNPANSTTIGGALVTVPVCHGGSYGFDFHRCTSSGGNGQLHRVNPANIKGSTIRVPHQGGFMMPLSTQDERWKTPS
ncbi:hypothetical protein ACTXT7_008288 [Hymenolepis weldensis]